ncbi:MAG TPA: lamin tail domain-containing protein [Nocardioides sp.]|jgi:hypothetical protein
MKLLAPTVLFVALSAATPTAVHATSASPAYASGGVRFSKVSYNSPGSDTGSNASLNAEWARITNHSSSARSLTGWTVRDLAGHVYRFGTFTLRAGASVRLHTGHGSNTRTDVYWRQSWYIWNNTGDKAILKKPSGTTVDTCRWDGSGSVALC